MWRKNLHDNDGDNEITNADGVDPNRNYPEHWGYDEEGSESQFTSETYRGDAPGSEAETKALMGLHDKVGFEFSISYHSFGPLLLYPQGWQVQTPSADDPIYLALTGDDTTRRCRLQPGCRRRSLHDERRVHRLGARQRGHARLDARAERGLRGLRLRLPGQRNARRRRSSRRTRQFAVNVAKSAADPDDPASHMGLRHRKTFYLDISQIDAVEDGNPAPTSRSDVVRRRFLAAGRGARQAGAGAVTLHYWVNGDAVQTATTSESPNGERFGGNNAYNKYYHYLRGEIPG